MVVHFANARYGRPLIVMKIRTLCVLSCLAGMFVPFSVLARTESTPPPIKGSITVPGKDLVFNYQYRYYPPDEDGDFRIGIKLPQKEITASACWPGNILAVEMNNISILYTPLTANLNSALIERKKAYYQELLKFKKENKMVTIDLQGVFRTDLLKEGDHLYAPYCNVAFAGFDK